VEELTRLFNDLFQRSAGGAGAQPNLLAGADDEIDQLFQ
jgi:hypothetical protein